MDSPSQESVVKQAAKQRASKQPKLDPDVAVREQYARLNFQLYIEMGEQRVQSDNHEKRLQNLRKENEYLNSTEWQFDPIEKFIGQA